MHSSAGISTALLTPPPTWSTGPALRFTAFSISQLSLYLFELAAKAQSLTALRKYLLFNGLLSACEQQLRRVCCSLTCADGLFSMLGPLIMEATVVFIFSGKWEKAPASTSFSDARLSRGQGTKPALCVARGVETELREKTQLFF